MAKVRNHVLDLWKVYAAFLVLFTHVTQNIIMINGQGAFNGYLGKVSLDIDFPWPHGFYTLGFYTFTTGYWLMHAYQGMKRRGVFGHGHDMEHIWRYTAKSYISYAPLLTVCAVSGLISVQLFAPLAIPELLISIANALPQFLGLNGLTQFSSDVLFSAIQGLDASANVFGVTFHPAAWYLASLVAYSCVFFAMLVISERFTMFVFCPLWVGLGMLCLNGTSTLSGAVPMYLVNLWVPAVFGFAGWYLVNALQRAELKSGTIRLMTMVTVALYALNIIELITGEPYGLFGQDVLICVTIMLTLAMKDRFTLGFNALLAKLPGKRYLSDFGLGVFIFHYPALLPFSLATREGMDVGLACWGALAATVACAVVFVVVFNKVIKPFQKWLSGVFRLDRPEGMMLAAESELAAREAQAVEEAHTADPAVVPAKPDEALRAGACVVAGEVRA